MWRFGKPYLIFLGDASSRYRQKLPLACATRSRRIVWRSGACRSAKSTLGLPDKEPAAAAADKSAIVVARRIPPGGGRIPPSWVPGLRKAIEAGLDIVSGLHSRLEDVEGLADLAAKHNVQLINIRTPPNNLAGRQRHQAHWQATAHGRYRLCAPARNKPRSPSPKPCTR